MALHDLFEQFHGNKTSLYFTKLFNLTDVILNHKSFSGQSERDLEKGG